MKLPDKIKPLRQAAFATVWRVHLDRMDLSEHRRMKADAARDYLATGTGAMIEGEAELKGIAPVKLARRILHLHGARTVGPARAAELARQQAKAEIKAARTAADIQSIIDRYEAKP